ncbi:interleukin-18-like [Pelodytes ibericus]
MWGKYDAVESYGSDNLALSLRTGMWTDIPAATTSSPVTNIVQWKRMWGKYDAVESYGSDNLALSLRTGMWTDKEFVLYDIKEEIVYFKESDLQRDSWAKSNSYLKTFVLNTFNEALEAHPEDFSGNLAIFKEAYDKERACFEMRKYRDTRPVGLSVAFAIMINKKTYCLYCANTSELRFKEGALPTHIKGDTSDIIFYQKNFGKGDDTFFVFESALYKGYCLAYHEQNGQRKLFLKQRQDDVVDETPRFTLKQ